MSLQTIGGQLTVNDDGALFDDETCCCPCGECPGSFTAVVSGFISQACGTFNCLAFNGTYVLVRNPANPCLWSTIHPGGSKPVGARDAGLFFVGGTLWQIQSTPCWHFDKTSLTGCPPTGAYAWNGGICPAGSLTLS